MPICAFVSPRASSTAISRSRAVSSWAASAAAGDAAPAVAAAITVEATSGDSAGSPRCTARTAAMISAGSASFRRKPCACCLSARST